MMSPSSADSATDPAPPVDLPLPRGFRISALGIFRAAARGVVLLGIFAGAASHLALIVPFLAKPAALHWRARWLQRWSRHCIRTIGMRIEHRGAIPTSGMIVSNHLSYLDILAFSAITPCVFVAKREVADWPVIGFFARMAGTIFVDRSSRMQVAETNGRIENALRSGATVLLFPEGTSSAGHTVLPFRPAFFEPMIRTQCAATPAAVTYSLTDGSVADEVCYWRDMTLVPHLLNLLTKRSVHARIAFGPPAGVSSSRKSLALTLHEAVTRLQLGKGDVKQQ